MSVCLERAEGFGLRVWGLGLFIRVQRGPKFHNVSIKVYEGCFRGSTWILGLRSRGLWFRPWALGA